MPERNEILMDFVADAVNGRRGNTYKNQKIMVVSEGQGLKSSEKKDAQQRIGPKMQKFVQEPHIRHSLGTGIAGLDEYGQAGGDRRQPVT